MKELLIVKRKVRFGKWRVVGEGSVEEAWGIPEEGRTAGFLYQVFCDVRKQMTQFDGNVEGNRIRCLEFPEKIIWQRLSFCSRGCYLVESVARDCKNGAAPTPVFLALIRGRLTGPLLELSSLMHVEHVRAL